MMQQPKCYRRDKSHSVAIDDALLESCLFKANNQEKGQGQGSDFPLFSESFTYLSFSLYIGEFQKPVFLVNS